MYRYVFSDLSLHMREMNIESGTGHWAAAAAAVSTAALGNMAASGAKAKSDSSLDTEMNIKSDTGPPRQLTGLRQFARDIWAWRHVSDEEL